MNSVPVFGLPILNKPELLQAMFDTIDLRIERLYIVDNGGVVRPDSLKWPWDIGRIHVATPGYNMGVAQSWNQIMRANINAPFWVIGCNDVRLSSGALQALVDDMVAHEGKPYLSRIEMGNENWGNHFGVFALNPEAIDLCGWFDENFINVFFEDTEFIRRANALGLEIGLVKSSTYHEGNASWKGNPTLESANKTSWDSNRDYFDSGWGVEEGLNYWKQPTVSRIRSTAWPIPEYNNVKQENADV